MGIIRQHNIWIILSRVLPFVALVALIFVDFLDIESIKSILLYAILIVFSFVAVAWWYWTMRQIKKFSFILRKNEQEFQNVTKEVIEIKNKINN